MSPRQSLNLLAAGLMFFQGAALAGVEDGTRAILKGEFHKAFETWRPLAERGDVRVQAALGVMYHIGQGAPRQDLKKAAEWYRRAAEQGNAASQANLGMLYSKGAGVEYDLVQAYAWLEVASANSHIGPHRARDKIAALMSKAELSRAKALAREMIAKYVTPFRESSAR